MAWEHLAGAHGADRGMSDQENESFRTARWVMLPLCAVLVAVGLTVRAARRQPRSAVSAATGSGSGAARGHQSSSPGSDS